MTRSEFRVVVKLVIAQARHRPGRVVLTSLSTIAAACIVTWVVSGYDALIAQFGSLGAEYVGRYELLLVPARGGEGGRSPGPLSDQLLDAIRRDPAVAVVDPIFETTAKLGRVGGTGVGPDRSPALEAPTPPPGPRSGPTIAGGMAPLRVQARNPTLVGTDSLEPVHTLLRGRWFDPGRPELREGAITQDSAGQLGVELGDEVVVKGAGKSAGPSRIKIVAILEQPRRPPGPRFMVGLPPSREEALQGGPASHAVYVPIALAREIVGSPARISHAGVALKGGRRVEEFLARWSDRLSGSAPPVEVWTPEKVDGEVERSTTFESVRAQAYSAMGISLLAALFIIFTTLSMGVEERTRQFAMLRAVALTRWQVGGIVAIESLILGLIGWGGGLLAGWGLVELMARLRPESVSEGASLGWWCVALSGVCALGGSAAASILPAWRAMSVTPLEAMVPRQRGDFRRQQWLLIGVGLVLIAVNPLLTFFLPMEESTRLGVGAIVGCTSMAIGFVLLAPLAVLLTERLLGPRLARLLGLDPRLLATQLSSNMGRTVGTTVAMTIGLGLFVATQTWGYSMLAPFMPGDWMPDVVVSLAPTGVSDAGVAAIRHAKGLVAERFVPLAVRQVKFADDPTGFRVRPSATRQDNCVMIGLDPEEALGGARPLFPFRFVEGTREDAVALMRRGRYCLVPDHFARESGLGLGGKFRVIPPDDPANPLTYEIAGVVSMPGWHWISKNIRRGRAAGLMFASYETTRRDFNTGRASAFWADLDRSATEEEIKSSIRTLADREAVAKTAANPSPKARGVAPAFVSLMTVEGARKEVRQRGDNIIWALGELPLITLLVTSLGVINTVLSSIRARRWELGVLRSLGLTRSGLFRLIIAEALLIGVVACVLSLGFGTMAGYCGTGLTRYGNIRGGQITPLVIPWAKLMVGFAMAMGLCLLASLWPAFRTGRTEPLRLLQAGRAST